MLSVSKLRVFTVSTVAAGVLILSPTVAADAVTDSLQFQQGKITPIIENPIPVWASSRDLCSAIVSCDECQVTEQQYCRWNVDGKTSCCKKATEDKSSVFNFLNSFFGGLWGSLQQQPDAALEAGHVPDQQSSSMSGKVEPIASGDVEPESAAVKPPVEQSVPESGAVVPIKEHAEPESGAVQPQKQESEPESGAVQPQKQESEPESAAVTPIQVNPIPAWASSSDLCKSSTSCDECSEEGYCKYTEAGKPTCCVKTTDKASEQQQLTPAAEKLQSASIMPITENPIPASASSADVCNRRRSCDICTEAQYCKYTNTGVPQCCTLAVNSGSEVPQQEADNAVVNPNTNKAEPESAAVKPITSEQYPESGAVKPNAGPQEAESAAVKPIEAAAEPESAAVRPIENQIPAWASPSDVCLEMSCDECATHQYCQFTQDGRQQCCGKISMAL